MKTKPQQKTFMSYVEEAILNEICHLRTMVG